MDVVDGKATSLKRSIKSMTGSQEWKDADFFGKVDIAWDKIIAERNNVHFLDAEGCEFNQIDFMHLTRKGHAQQAEKLAELVPTLL